MRTAVLVSVAWSCLVAADPLVLLTEDIAPLNYLDQGRPAGLAVELVTELARRTGHDGSMQFQPWARAFATAQQQPGIGLFSTARLPEREQLFHWIGPLTTKDFTLFRWRAGAVTATTIDDAKQVGRIGVYKDSAKEKVLVQNGFANLDRVTDDRLNLKKLELGRIDLWICATIEVPFYCKQAGIPKDSLAPTITLKTVDLYLAISRGTAASVVTAWSDAFAAMQSDGAAARIRAAWE